LTRLLGLGLTLLLLRLTLWLLSRLALGLLSLSSLLCCHLALLLHIGHSWVHLLTGVWATSHLRVRTLLWLSLRTMLLLLSLLMLLGLLLLMLLLGLLLLLLLKCQLLRHHLLLSLCMLSLRWPSQSRRALIQGLRVSTHRSHSACCSLLPHMMHLLDLLGIQLQTHGHAGLHVILEGLLCQ
jgi:hypothetical protein